MTATLSLIPLDEIHPSGDNPRTHFEDDRMAELVASIKRHGIISPLTLVRDESGGYRIVAGERRYRAAKAAKLAEVPAQVRESNGAAFTVAIAENVIRADLSPLEEACAYRRLVDEHGTPAKVARLVGKSGRLIADRLELLRLPEGTQELLGARRIPLTCVPALVHITEREQILADLVATWLSDRPHAAAAFPTEPGEVVDDVLRAERRLDDESQLWPVAYSVDSFRGPLTPPGVDIVPAVLAKLGDHAAAVEAAYGALPPLQSAGADEWRSSQDEERRQRDCFCLGDDDADAARAFGCLLELPGRSDRTRQYVTDPVWLADRLAQKIGHQVEREATRLTQGRQTRAAADPLDEEEKDARRREREHQYEHRVAARARNLDLGAALAGWQPKVDTDAVKLLGTLALEHYGRAAAWAHRLCVEQETTENKGGRVTVHYPRGADAEREHLDAARAQLGRARTPEAALAVVLRLLVAQRLADTEGLPNPDRQGIHEPQILAESAILTKLARRITPPSIKRHHADQESLREVSEQPDSLPEAA